MNETRQHIRTHVYRRPGIHFNRLVRESGYAPGQVQYHLRRLGDTDDVVDGQFYGRTHYYPPEYDDWERGALALLRRETAREITLYVLEEGPARPGEVADALGIARSTLSWQAARLVECEVIEKRRDEHARMQLAPAHPERTGALLSRTAPSFPDRLVDRFVALVDGVLDGPVER